jgi:mRNA interferase MazF
MQKDFERWNSLKIKLNESRDKVFYAPREIWFCSIGVNVGAETDGKNEKFTRPVLVFKIFSEEMFLGIPITSKLRIGRPYYQFKIGENQNNAVLTQIRVLSRNRLERKIGTMSEHDFDQLRTQLIRLL